MPKPQDYTYRFTKIPIEPDTPIWIGSYGGMMTDVITPKAYIDLLIERKIKALDERMVKYIDRYRRARRKLRDQRHDTSKKYKGVGPFEIIHNFTPEEREEFKHLYDESLASILKKRDKHE